MEVNIEQEVVKNGNLRKVQETETDLRRFRDKKETELLNVAVQSQKESEVWMDHNLKVVEMEDSRVQQEAKSLKDKMNHRKNTIVEQLLQDIE